MKAMASYLMGGIALVAVGGLFLVCSGCEKATGLAGLSIDPSYVTLTPGSNSVILAVTGVTNNLALPLEWSVSDPALGTIQNHSGYTAVYKSTDRSGQNTVTVRDQYENEGFATINQVEEQYSLSLAADPSTTISASNSVVTITVENASEAQPPFDWSVSDSSLGEIEDAGGSSAVYRSRRAGSNVIHVEDANGAAGSIAITQR